MSNDTQLNIRLAERKDAQTVLDFIRAIAEYEIMIDEVKCDVKMIENELFDKKSAEVLIGEQDGTPVAFALFYYNFSTFLGRRGVYLEDIFINSECRSNGYGKLMIKELAKIAKERGCGRMEWRCLKWNEPSLAFYKSIGAEVLEDWVSLTLPQEKIDELIK